MSSITKRMKKLSVQRDHYINPWTGLVTSRAATHGRSFGTRRPYTAAEIRAERLYYAQQDRELQAQMQRARKTQRPVYGKPIRQGAAVEAYWVNRKTPDRSVLRQQSMNAVG